jgi:hypothetical protein
VAAASVPRHRPIISNALPLIALAYQDMSISVHSPNNTAKRKTQDAPILMTGGMDIERWICRECNGIHRDDGPALIKIDGTQYWYSHGSIHRNDGPAVIRPDGTQEWWLDHRRHRNDGPAVIRADGNGGLKALR